MLDQFVLQVRRLFSSKTNSGRLVYNITDRLHYYKQVIFGASIVLLLGYSQFRSHFDCQGVVGLDKKVLGPICWINGTTTFDMQAKHQAVLQQNLAKVNRSDENSIKHFFKQLQHISDNIPHVGLSFEDGKYEVNHNYMQSLWSILILMVVCSFIAQRKWASIFNNDILRALLKLPGHENLPLVKKAQQVNPYGFLIYKLRESNNTKEQSQRQQSSQHNKEKLNHNLENNNNNNNNRLQIELTPLSAKNKSNYSEIIDVLTGNENEHSHTLDYYPNQLIYLLLARQTAAYKMSSLRLKRKLILYSMWSLLLTSMQYIIPLSFIGEKYKLYGWNFFRLWLKTTIRQLKNPRLNINSINYELSSSIFPTSVICDYRQFGLQGFESVKVQCTVSINEICSKLFVVIWWFVIINIIIEFYSLLYVLICSLNFGTIRWCTSRNKWPKSRSEAKKLATFRYRHAVLLNNHQRVKQQSIETTTTTNQKDSKNESNSMSNKQSILVQIDPTISNGNLKEKDHNNLNELFNLTENNNNNNNKQQPDDYDEQKVELSEKERKIREAECERSFSSSNNCLNSKKWYLWCPRDIGVYLLCKGKKCGKRVKNSTKLKKLTAQVEDEEGYKEIKEDPNIYYLFYLLYLRLNKSSKKVERIIRMSSNALEKYLRNLDELYILEGTDDEQVAAAATTTTTAAARVEK